MSARRDYDVIVVGASFAGLAVARELSGDVLLLDRHEIGTVQTSACGTPLWIARALGVEDSVLQVHEYLDLRTPSRTITFDLRDVPFCTFDYGAFTRGMLHETRATFRRAAVIGGGGNEVRTTDGRYTAPIVVDASGWRGALVAGPSSPPGRSFLSFGLETRTPLTDDRLVLVLDRQVIPRGLAWVFPVGRGSLVGLGSYTGESRLGAALDRFVAACETPPGPRHGTFFPHRLLRPTVGPVFAVGDAAGQCFPLTAEGIRPALYFGTMCGRIVRRVLEGGLAIDAARREYAALVDRYRAAYRVLAAGQWLAEHAPNGWFGFVASLFRRGPLQPRWWPRYGLFGRFEAAVPSAIAP